jgi:hypothetical protein
MEWILTTAGVAFVLSVLVAPFAIKKLRELKFGQKILEDGPTWHMSKQGTPTMGGLIFIAGMLVAVLCKLPWMVAHQDYRALVMLGLSLVFAGVGIIDDWTKIKKKKNQGITPKQKLALQMAAAVLFVTVMRVMGYLESSLYIPFTGISLAIPFPVYVVFSIFIIIGADNAWEIRNAHIGEAASVAAEVVQALFDGFIQGGKIRDRNTRSVTEFLQIVKITGSAKDQQIIRTEGGHDHRGKGFTERGDLFVIRQILGGIVGGSHVGHARTLDHDARRIMPFSNHAVCLLINSVSRLRIQGPMDIKIQGKLHLGPMV